MGTFIIQQEHKQELDMYYKLKFHLIISTVKDKEKQFQSKSIPRYKAAISTCIKIRKLQIILLLNSFMLIVQKMRLLLSTAPINF